MTIIFFSKMFKIWCRFQNWNKRIRKCFWIYAGPVGFNISVREIISESVSFRVMKKKKMIKWYHANFTRVWDPLICWISKGALKRCYLEIALTESFRVSNFRNKVAMTIIFFSKCLKFDEESRNGTKQSEKLFGFKDNCIWVGEGKFSQSRTGYLSLAVNVLRNNSKI